MWTKSFLVLLVLLSAFSPLYSEICLSETEWTELDQAFKTLNDLLETQDQELELAETQLVIAEQEIEKLELSLKELELSLKLHEKEQTKKTIAWVVGSLIVGTAAGFLAGMVLE